MCQPLAQPFPSSSRLIVLKAARTSLQSSGWVRLASMASWIGYDIDIKQVLLLGFITSPLEFSQSECQTRALTQPAADAPLQDTAQASNETKDHGDQGDQVVVMNEISGEQTRDFLVPKT